jgi:Trypsin
VLKKRLPMLWAAAIMLLTVLACSGIALAITNGTPDGRKASDGSYTYPTDGSYKYKYPHVGALSDPKGFGDGTYTYCTGTLISPTVFLTAAHCDPVSSHGVTFDAKYAAGSSKVYKICRGLNCTEEQAGGQFDGKFKADPNGYDIAVVVFFDPPFGDPPKLDNGTPDDLTEDTPITLAQLPTSHQFDTAAKGGKFTAVGYGGYKATESGGSSSIAYDDVRRYAVSTLKSVNQDYLRLSQNQGSGGTCYGDSGGPNFVGEYGINYDTDPATPLPAPTIASITNTGDTWCNSTNVTLRLDTATARTFLSRPFLDGEGIKVP